MKTLHDQQKNGLLIQIFLYKYKTEVTTKLLFTVIPHKLREDSVGTSALSLIHCHTCFTIMM